MECISCNRAHKEHPVFVARVVDACDGVEMGGVRLEAGKAIMRTPYGFLEILQVCQQPTSHVQLALW